MQQAEGFFNSSNTAVGAHALYSNQEEANVAVGAFALTDNAFGSANTATGYYALSSNADGSNNVAAGFEALKLSLGSDNTALGYRAISNGTSGARNTGVGVTTLKKVIKGVDNSALGSNAGPSGDFSNTTALGAGATPTQSNQVRVGNSNTTVIGGQVSWSTTSDARFKTHVKDDVPGLAFIKKLRPVTFDWDQAKLDAFYGNAASNPASDRKPSRRYTGFLAQQVEEAAKACEFDFSGVKKPESESSPYELSYADFVVPLVKTVQEQQQQIERLNAIVAKLEARSGPAMSMGLTGGLAPWALISSCLLAAGLAAHLRWRRRRAA
jgi:hypothetical protein